MSIFDDIDENERRWMEAAYWRRWRRRVIFTTVLIVAAVLAALSQGTP